MNGSANGFAGALFFSLVAIGVILAIGDIIGWGIGAVSAIFAAISPLAPIPSAKVISKTP